MALREILAVFGIEVETKELEKGDSLVDDFKDKLLGFGKVVAAAFAIDAVIGFTKSLIDSADELREAAIALGLPAQQLQALEFAAGMAGVGVDELRGSLAKFNKIAAESSGGKGASAEFKKLGIEIRNADGSAKTSGQLFEQVGSAIGAIQDPIERAGIASKFFGRSYAKLLPLFAEGPEGFKRAREEAEALGIVFDDAFLNNSDEINDNLAKLSGGLKGLAKKAIGPLLPFLVEYTQRGVDLVKQIGGWVKGTKLIQAATVGFAAKGVMALVKAIPMVIKLAGGWRAAFMALNRVVFRTLLPLLLLEDLLVFFAGGKSAIGKGLDKLLGPGAQDAARQMFQDLGKLIGLLKSDPTEGFGERIRGTLALIRKDFVSVFGEELTSAFGGTVDMLTGGWSNFKQKFSAITRSLVLPFKVAMEGIRSAALIVAGAVQDIFATAWNGILLQLNAVLVKLGTLLLQIPGMKELGKGAINAGADVLGGLKGTGNEASARSAAAGRFGALAEEGRANLAELDSRRGIASAPVPPPAITTTTIDQKVDLQQHFHGSDSTDPGKVRGAAKQGVVQGLNLRAAHAAGVQRGG